MSAPIALAAADLQSSVPHASPPLSDTRFTVPGIRCAGCIAKIERELGGLEGVHGARVNFSAKRVAVRHDERLDDDALLGALARLGFEAQPVIENASARDDDEIRSLLRALAVACFGMMNIMLLSVSVWSGAGGVTRDMFHLLSAVIAMPVVAYSGRPFFVSAWKALRHGRTNMDVPISVGVLLATGISFHETLVSGPHAYFDGAVSLLFFLLAGRTLDASMRGRTRKGIGALLSRMGRSASVVQPDGTTQRLAAEDLEPGMIMLLAAGEALAADGDVIDGAGAIDNAMLTGESTPEPVTVGSRVHAGALNLGGALRVRITATSGDTVLAEIARLMEEAGQSKSRYVRIADRASQLYTPAVHSLALIALVGWLIAGAGWHQSILIATAVLIITCPCAMGLAVPTAQVVASGVLARKGVLVKDGSALERLAEVDTVVFDKTGTLTLGEPRAAIAGLGPAERQVALALAQASRHPLSRGLAASLLADGVVPAPLTDLGEVPGRGMIARWGGQEVALEPPAGNTSGLATVLRVADRTHTITFHDAMRSDAAATVDRLAELGLASRILSGDRPASVAQAAEALGIDGSGGVSPPQKLAVLEDLKAAGRFPLMVGDGLNDGPALAAAHASLAPGSASDASQQAADAVFLGSKLMPVAEAVRVSRATMRIVRQNIRFSVIYNVFAVPLALAGLVTPLVAAVSMSLSSVVVVANSLRLARLGR